MGESITLQRRSLKVDVQLSSFATFVLFEQHVKSKFDLTGAVSAGQVEIELKRHRERQPASNPTAKGAGLMQIR